MWGILPCTLYQWYRNYLSDYLPDIKDNKWPSEKIITEFDQTTGEVVKEKPVYVFKKENLGENMSIDDKSIGHDGFTILSNNDTSKIALMIESTNAKEVEQAMELFGNELQRIRNISMDMSATYALVCNNLIPRAKQVIDKFHVMQYVYDAVSEVRTTIKKELTTTLSKGKKRTEEDKEKLRDIELLRRVRYAVTQSPDKWNKEMENTVNLVFAKHDELKTAYQISQKFKQWYLYENRFKSMDTITENLYQWYKQAWQIKEFQSVIKMIRKHENEILNFFHHGITNAKAERLNGKIKRFVSSNYGIKDKDFALYRIAKYFA